jgi:hypothetical protein
MCVQPAHTSLPTTPPTNSLAEPAVWFHEPAVRSGWSLVTAPVEEALTPGSFTVAWDASYSALALSCLACPSACQSCLSVC